MCERCADEEKGKFLPSMPYMKSIRPVVLRSYSFHATNSKQEPGDRQS